MSRLRHFTQGVVSSWLGTFVTVVYSLLSVPIALKFLSVDEFGLLMLLQQAGTYFSLVDLGMTAATARILIDHKDRPHEGTYASFIVAGGAVCLLQALLILAGGWLVAPVIIRAFSIAPDYVPVAVYLLRWLAAAFAVGAAMRIFSSVLYANRRIDLLVLLMSLVPLLGLALTWIVLARGMGLPGMAWTFVVPALVAGIGTTIAAFSLGLMPAKDRWERPSLGQFREMFLLGKDMFLITVGNQILEASQLMIVTRTMGLGAAAIWSVSSKLFSLIYQLVTKVEGTAIVFFSEMMVRGEIPRLALRFRHVYQLTAGLCVVALAVVTAINRPFVSVWASSSLVWSSLSGILLGVLVYLNCLTKCHVDFIMHSKDIRGLKYIFLFESIAFISVALYSSTYLGFCGILGSAISCIIVFRGIYTVRRTANYFNISTATVAWGWLRPSLLALMLLLPFVLFAPLIASLTTNPWRELVFVSVWIFVPALAVLGTVAFPYNLRREIIDRITARLRAG